MNKHMEQTPCVLAKNRKTATGHVHCLLSMRTVLLSMRSGQKRQADVNFRIAKRLQENAP
jgi:hypothetical protein